MSSDPAIVAEGLSKRYRLGTRASYGRLTESLSRFPSTRLRRPSAISDDFWALTDATFEVSRGEVVGIIGRNGSGKSTLLKILARVTRPSMGSASLRGRVGSLLEVGTGFHPDLTGRENVYLSGAILGMNRREIDGKFEQIVTFADIGPFLDTPVKRYSSGMQVRLGFAVAAHLETEILLIDEVLAVGDMDFQQKCLDQMDEASKSGRTILLVSHNPAAVSRLCTTTLLLDEGKVLFNGPTEDTLRIYFSGENPIGSWTSRDLARSEEQDFRFLRAEILGENALEGERMSGTEPMTVDLTYELTRQVSGLMVGLALHDQSGVVVLETYELDGLGMSALDRSPGIYHSRCYFPGGLLNTGTYWFSLIAFEHNVTYLQVEPRALRLEIWDRAVPGAEYSMDRGGVIAPSFRWEFSNG